MIKTYKFEYGFAVEASANFKVDTEKFTAEMANNVLGFFTWDYDEEGDPIDEVMKKYAMEAIIIATNGNWNTRGVISQFNDREGYYPVDGSVGIELTYCDQYEFNDEDLSCTIT